jgi:hypothetical protein
MEWFFLILGGVIFLGPIVWAFTKGRNSQVPDHEDAQGSTGYEEFIRNVESPPGQR